MIRNKLYCGILLMILILSISIISLNTSDAVDIDKIIDERTHTKLTPHKRTIEDVDIYVPNQEKYDLKLEHANNLIKTNQPKYDKAINQYFFYYDLMNSGKVVGVQQDSLKNKMQNEWDESQRYLHNIEIGESIRLNDYGLNTVY